MEKAAPKNACVRDKNSIYVLLLVCGVCLFVLTCSLAIVVKRYVDETSLVKSACWITEIRPGDCKSCHAPFSFTCRAVLVGHKTTDLVYPTSLMPWELKNGTTLLFRDSMYMDGQEENCSFGDCKCTNPTTTTTEVSSVAWLSTRADILQCYHSKDYRQGAAFIRKTYSYAEMVHSVLWPCVLLCVAVTVFSMYRMNVVSGCAVFASPTSSEENIVDQGLSNGGFSNDMDKERSGKDVHRDNMNLASPQMHSLHPQLSYYTNV